MAAVNHARWDDGAFKNTMKLLGQRTVKTHCDRRVAMHRADPDAPVTCPFCQSWLDDRDAALKSLGITS